MSKRKLRVSSADVARHAGLSRTTVSYVLNNRQNVSIPKSTRERVLRAAEELGYRPNGVARCLVSGRTQTIGVIVPVLESSFTTDVVNGVEEVCSKKQYRMLLAYSHNDPDLEVKQARLLLEHRVDGIICVAGYRSLGGTDCWVEEALRERVSCIVVDDSNSTRPVDYVVSDDYNGAVSAVGHLIHLGHRRIGHISAVSLGSPARERHGGYVAALRGAGLPLDSDLVKGDSFDPAAAVAAMAELLDLSDPPTAVFAANDLLAVSAMEVVKRRGLRVPEDIAFVGFSDFSLARYMRLTTVRRSPSDMGRCAAEQLLTRMNHAHSPKEGIVVPTHLVVRESCGAAMMPREKMKLIDSDLD